MRRVMVFGVFDGLHPGHRAFLKEACSYGDYLIVVVTPDHIVFELKQKNPRATTQDRIDALKKEIFANEVVEGDAALGVWGVIEKYTPDVIAFGHDQGALRKSLEEYFGKKDFQPEMLTMHSFNPERYKSSLINGTQVK